MNTYKTLLDKFEYGFFGGCSLGILVSSCIGGIAAMAVLQNGTSPLQVFELFLVVAFAMTFNGSVISQQKPKVVFNTLILSIGVNLLLAVINYIKYYT